LDSSVRALTHFGTRQNLPQGAAMPETLDKWTKELPNGRFVVYTRNTAPETGGAITARVGYVAPNAEGVVVPQAGDIVHTDVAQAPMTREEVEAHFTNL
jgi:hypothetical protein